MIHGWAYDNGMEMMSQLGLIPKGPKADGGKGAKADDMSKTTPKPPSK